MFSNKLKRPALSLAVTAGLLAVAGPASASIVYNGHAGLGSAGLKFDSNEWAEAVDQDLHQPDMGIRDLPPLAIITDLPPVTAGGLQARSAVLPELDANANAFLPEVNDEVLAALQLELDYIEGTQFVELNRSPLAYIAPAGL